MVLSLGRILQYFRVPAGRPAIPMIDLSRLSDHHLADLNLPRDISDAAEARRIASLRLTRW